jgi:DNA modification methylase
VNIHCAYDAMVPIKDLKPHPRNRNKHPTDQIDRLAKIIDYQGIRQPIKVSKRSGFITAGHGRIEAFRRLKLKEVPVNFQDYESDEQEYADLQSDNAIASWAELDLSGINADIGDLGPGFDIDLLGIKGFEIDVADREPGCDEDEVPEVKESFVKPGDIWMLGNHRLMCGDSTSIDAAEKLMAGEKADMVFTDPPYNLGFKYNSHDDNMESSEYQDFCISWFNCLKAVTNKIIITPGTKNLPMWMRIDSEVQGIGCWVKKNWITSCKISNLQQWEPILFYGPFGRSRHSDLYEINRKYQEDVGDSHTCPKQIELLEDIFNSYGEKSILDVFGGSGSTLIACEKTNRKCFMMEIDPHYCGVIIERWQKYTGQKAELLNG